VNLSNESVRLPLYPGIAYKGTPQQEKLWYILLDASDSGLAHDLGQLRAQAGQHRDQRPGRGAGRDAGEPDTAGEPVRPRDN
jgi:hypothetical protein